MAKQLHILTKKSDKTNIIVKFNIRKTMINLHILIILVFKVILKQLRIN